MDLLSSDISDEAKKYLELFECEIIDGAAFSCEISKTKDLDRYTALQNFIDGSQAFPEMVFVILEHFSEPMPNDDFEKLRWATKEIQQKISLMYYDEANLMDWGVNEGRKWVDRSLRVSADPSFNQKMFDSLGNLRLKNIFVHANHQYIYNCALDVLGFLNRR